MYKKESNTKHTIKPSNNLFSLLDEDDGEDSTISTDIPVSNPTTNLGTKPTTKPTTKPKAGTNIIIEDDFSVAHNTRKTNGPHIPGSNTKVPYNQHNQIINNIEDEMFKQYYGRKVYKNFDNKFVDNKKVNQDLNDGFMPVGKRKEKQIVECKFKTMEPNLLELNMGNYYKVLVHHNDDQNWDYISYHNICTLYKWEDIPKLFNTLDKSTGETKYTDFDIFIMKNDISPMWEDTENRNGSICSIKIDSLKDGYEILKQLLIYAANNTLMEFSPESWDKINGLSFSPKRMDNTNSDSSFCVILKIWFKQNYGNNTNIDKYLNPHIQELLKKYSVKVKSIRPEY